MDIKKALSVKLLRELVTITACLSHNNKTDHSYSRGKDKNE